MPFFSRGYVSFRGGEKIHIRFEASQKKSQPTKEPDGNHIPIIKGFEEKYFLHFLWKHPIRLPKLNQLYTCEILSIDTEDDGIGQNAFSSNIRLF